MRSARLPLRAQGESAHSSKLAVNTRMYINKSVLAGVMDHMMLQGIQHLQRRRT